MAKITLLGPKAPSQQVKAASPRKTAKEPQLFDTLFPCTFRGIHFPVVSMSVSFSQDMAEHKYYGVGAANVEMTGGNPRTFEAEIPFVNGITPGKNERWGVLWPDAFREFLAAMETKTTGYLDTPDIRGLTVKPVSIEYKYDANTRDGVMVTARWLETVDQKVFSKEEFDSEDHAVRLAALSLDAEYVPTARMVTLPPNDISFEELANEIAGAIDTASSKLHILANKPAQILYRVKKVQDAIERAANPLTWPGRESCERIEEAANAIRKAPGKLNAIVNADYRMVSYRTKNAMTLSQLAILTQMSVDDLLQANPNLAAKPRIPAGTLIRRTPKNGNNPV